MENAIWAQCPHCGTEVPSSNLTLHIARCQQSHRPQPSAPPLDPEPLTPQLEADLSTIELGEPIPYEGHEPPAYPSLPPLEPHLLPSPPSYQQQPNTAEALLPPSDWHTVATNGLFTLQANQSVRRLVQRGPVHECGTLGDAVSALTSVPPQILQADLAAVRGSDDADNATLVHGPDENGDVYEIEHTRSLNWWLQHDCQASAYTRRATPKEAAAANVTVSAPDGAFRLIAIHPVDTQRALAVLHHTATSLDDAHQALSAASSWSSRSLPRHPEEAYEVLANTPGALEDLIEQCVPLVARQQEPPTSPAQRILADRVNQTAPHEADAAEDHAEEDHEELECPVCMEAIGEADAAMRCRGTGGHRHYFHSQCLSRWASTCRGNWAQATCPVCRGGVDVHSERLADFLNGTESAQLDETSRGNLHGMLQGLGQKVTGWTSLSQEQVAEGVGVLAGAGVGFYQGYYGQAPTSGNWALDGYVWDNAPSSVRAAYFGGWVGGLGIRFVRYMTREKKSDDK